MIPYRSRGGGSTNVQTWGRAMLVGAGLVPARSPYPNISGTPTGQARGCPLGSAPTIAPLLNPYTATLSKQERAANGGTHDGCPHSAAFSATLMPALEWRRWRDGKP